MLNPEPYRRPDRLLAVLLTTAITVVGVARPSLADVPPPASRYASIVMEAETGNILYERNADLPRFPASLTKMMTLYLAFEALTSKKITLGGELIFSEHAVSRDPSRLDLTAGSRLKVEDAIRAMTTKSANDAACALGEALAGGSEERFGQMMTAKASALGMKHTTFHNASGLPDDGHITTARDLAILGRALVHDYPDYYRYFATPSFDWRGMRYPNQNRFLRTYYGADGIKTGFVNASGHNLAASAVRGGKRLIAIVLGGDTQSWTREHASSLLDLSYAKIDPSLVMVASNESGAAAVTAEAGAAIAKSAPTTQTYSTPAGAVTIKSPPAAAPAIAMPNATANLTAYAAAASAPKAPAGSVGPAPIAAPVASSSAVPEMPTPIAAIKPAQGASAAVATAATPRGAVAAAAHSEILVAGAAPLAAPAPTTLSANAPAKTPAAPGKPSAQNVSAPKAEPSRPSIAPADGTTGSNTAIAPITEEEIARSLKGRGLETASLAPAARGASATAVAAEPQQKPHVATDATEQRDGGRGRGEWSVQVGVYRDATVARRRGEEARSKMPLPLRSADLVVGRAQDGVHVTSRIGSLSEQEAREACSELQRGRLPCVVVPPGRPMIVATN